MALQQYRVGQTYYGYDPSNQQAIAFSTPQSFNKYFGSFDNNAPAPTFDVSKLNQTPDQLLSLAPPPQATPQAAPQQQARPTMPTYAPPTYTPPQIDTSNLKALEQQYASNLQPSGEETQTQQQLDSLITSRDMGLNKIEAQPIPMDLLVGQSSMLQKQAATAALPSQQRLALAQAKRQAALDASRFALQREDQRIADVKNESRYAFEQSESQARNAYNTAFQGYQQQFGEQQYNTEQQQLAQKNAVQNRINQPYYQVGNQIINTATGRPEYENVGGEIRRLSDGKRYSTPQQFFSDSGIISWEQIQKEVGAPQDKLLSPTEAARLGVPYGTTQQQAASLSITPNFGKASSGRSTSTSTSDDSGFTGKASRGRVEDYIKLVVNESGGVNDQNRYLLWEAVAKELEASGVTPTSYDDIFWKYFHPEGTKGYNKYKLGR